MRLFAAAVAASLAIGLIGGVQAAANVQVTSLDCAKHPGLLDLIYITNTGDAAQDLSGWQLRSDPEDTQQMSLSRVGSLAPGAQIVVVAGVHAVDRPEENTYLWSNEEILRDAGDPPDYVRILDAAGNSVGGMDCTGAPLAAPATPAPPPTAAPQAPSDNATPPPQAAAVPADASADTTSTDNSQSSATAQASATVVNGVSATGANTSNAETAPAAGAGAVPTLGGDPGPAPTPPYWTVIAGAWLMAAGFLATIRGIRIIYQ